MRPLFYTPSALITLRDQLPAKGESPCGSSSSARTVKKSECDLGESRGRSISATDRMKAVQLIDEAVDHGARLSKACECLGITDRTYYRWQFLNKEYNSYEDRRVYADHSEPVNKLTPEERQKVIDTVNEERFASMPPCEIIPALADEGKYIASESTFYRILREEKMQNHRRRSQEPGKHGKPTSYVATPLIRSGPGVSHISEAR